MRATAAIVSSAITPGPLGIAETSPRAEAPRRTARRASSTPWMQQTFRRGRRGERGGPGGEDRVEESGEEDAGTPVSALGDGGQGGQELLTGARVREQAPHARLQQGKSEGLGQLFGGHDDARSGRRVEECF